MTDKVQKIREEIEKRLKGERFLSSDKEYNYLLSFIDSLQEEPASENLDEASHQFVFNTPSLIIPLFHDADLKWEMTATEELERAFKAGANWQKQRNNIPQELIDTYCEFQKVGGDSVRVVINAINAIKEKQL